MIERRAVPADLVHATSAGGDTADRRLRLVAETARSAAAIVDEVRELAGGLDGGLTIRLIEASHALHRAAVALGDGHLDAATEPLEPSAMP